MIKELSGKLHGIGRVSRIIQAIEEYIDELECIVEENDGSSEMALFVLQETIELLQEEVEKYKKVK